MKREYIIEPFLENIAANFWKSAGGYQIWPLDLVKAIAFSLPLDVVILSSLSISKIEQWFDKRGAPYRFPCASRNLHGCLLVYRGAGFVFVDGWDDKSEQRFTLGHEIAHFLFDYWLPRQRALQEFGEDIKNVLDGLRPPTLDEQVQSVLTEVTIKPYTHLIEKDGIGYFERSDVWKAENRADQLGLEIIAPAAIVCADIEATGITEDYPTCLSTAKALLQEKYGLPLNVISHYASRIAFNLTKGPSILESLGLT